LCAVPHFAPVWVGVVKKLLYGKGLSSAPAIFVEEGKIENLPAEIPEHLRSDEEKAALAKAAADRKKAEEEKKKADEEKKKSAQ